MPFSDKQQEFFRNANHRWNIKVGATRSGKTYMDYYVIPKRIRARAEKEGLVAILGVSKGTIQRNIIEPLQRIWGTKLVGDINSQNICPMFGEDVYCLGAEKVSQVSKIRGSSLKYCYGDEVVTWSESVFTMLKSRLDKPYSRFDGTCNPDNPNHWFYSFLHSNADIYLQEYTLHDNPYLSSDFVKNLEDEYRGTVFFDRYILGKWTLAEGLIYPYGADGKATVPDELRAYTKYVVSIDYGTLNPCSMGLWGLCDGVWYRIREYYYSGRSEKHNLTDEQYYIKLVELIGGLPVSKIVVDPSAASFIACIRAHRRYIVREANNAVLDGIRNTAVALTAQKIKICECCTNTLAEFSAYRWDENAGEDRPIKENDHAMDDMRYFVNTILHNTGGFFAEVRGDVI